MYKSAYMVQIMRIKRDYKRKKTHREVKNVHYIQRFETKKGAEAVAAAEEGGVLLGGDAPSWSGIQTYPINEDEVNKYCFK